MEATWRHISGRTLTDEAMREGREAFELPVPLGAVTPSRSRTYTVLAVRPACRYAFAMALPTMPCTIELEDYDGFLSFADAPAYKGFIGDWDLPEILALFANQSRAGTLAIQYVGQENAWASIEVLAEPSALPAVRELALPITITSGALWATCYTDLTMVAQFDSEQLVEQSGTEQVLALPNGDYTLNFRWLTFNDENDTEDSSETPNRVELVITPGSCAAPEVIPGGAALL